MPLELDSQSQLVHKRNYVFSKIISSSSYCDSECRQLKLECIKSTHEFRFLSILLHLEEQLSSKYIYRLECRTIYYVVNASNTFWKQAKRRPTGHNSTFLLNHRAFSTYFVRPDDYCRSQRRFYWIDFTSRLHTTYFSA